ncbi:helicase C-terminal domain-containing protein [Bombilactobacillus thymidiniphilus]|uniref:3'-5' exonuclease DinG n=1 Tax=Bombilactobacillus thymidiniphilus TaxID=2923363 RepID=A0ABY4PE59_9LACO|nr:helicase C-terminal domain-containing protein [Bombilactobacillus thymidiniphilus]UQS83562.1 DEAD/DEAH box helicase [Bombilactobacillus thymidiniphilus]
MMKDKKYVVVDLETTGTQRNKNDRIIQFAAVVIVDHKITEQISFLINPRCEINNHVSMLTGITNDQLVEQPTFDYFADEIWQLLQDSVFVAHNVNFDLPFLQSELIAAGYPMLDISAIDTVELAQILLPCEPSFKLAELSLSLGIIHEKPHQADSDALATAKLFLYLRQCILQLPAPTLKMLRRFSSHLLRQTGDFFDLISQQIDETASLANDLLTCHGIVLHQTAPIRTTILTTNSKYPATKKAKQRLFADTLQIREDQSRLMNFVQRKITQATSLAMVDAPTGSGKTLGYLLPLSYLLDNGKKAVVATSTKLLQQQIMQKEIPLIEKLRHKKYNVTLLSSPHDYIDLNKFYQLLWVPEHNRQNYLLKMRLLVWLTQTKTGDLRELNLTKYENDLFNLLRSTQYTQGGLFATVNFWPRQLKAARNADLIITNHAFLLHNLTNGLWSNNASLILDEASSLLQQTLKSHVTFDVSHLKNALKKISDLLYQNRIVLRSFFKGNQIGSWTHQNLADFQANFEQLQSNLTYLTTDLVSNYIKQLAPLDQRNSTINLTLMPPQIKKKTRLTLKKTLQEIRNLLAQLAPLFTWYQQIQDNSLLEIDSLLLQIRNEYILILRQEQNLMQLLWDLDNEQHNLCWLLTMNNYHNWDSLQLSSQLLDQKNILDLLTGQFTTCILIGAALQYQHSLHNFCLQLGITQPLPRTDRLVLPAPENLEQKLQIYLPQNALDPQKDYDYSQHLAQQIYQLTKDHDYQTLVLFNSLQTLQAVYEQLQLTDLAAQREILAQNISGSNARLKKRFAVNDHSMLLAVNGFGEGVNLAPQKLKLVIITRLPFEAPENPFVRAKNQYWKRLGKDPFKVESLPTVVRRLKQQVGRLIRGPKDQGAIVFLDPRIVHSNYGPQIYQELNLPPLRQPATLSEIIQELKVLLK